MPNEALSGCAVRAEKQVADANNDAHYFRMIKHRLTMLYELTDAPNMKEQISDEIDWVDEKLELHDRA